MKLNPKIIVPNMPENLKNTELRNIEDIKIAGLIAITIDGISITKHINNTNIAFFLLLNICILSILTIQLMVLYSQLV